MDKLTPEQWREIREKYENGTSQHNLAREYGVSQPAISAKAKREGWIIIPRIHIINDNPLDNPDKNTSPSALADMAIADLAKYLLEKEQKDAATIRMELREHKLFADSFSQYIRAKLLLPDDKPTESGLPSELLPYLNNNQLSELTRLQNEIDEILEDAKAKKLESETGIRPLRKQA